MDIATTSKISNAARAARVEARAKELMLAAGMQPEYFTPHSPAWTPKDAETRDKALTQARGDVATELGLPQWEPARDNNDIIDWSAEPKDALRRAIQERDAAEADRDKASLIAKNAAELLAKCESEVKQYANLDKQVEEYAVEAARNGNDDTLPYALEQAAKERSRAIDRLDRASKVHRRLHNELLEHQQKLEQARRLCRLWAQRICIMEAEALAQQFIEQQAHADELKDRLSAFSYTAFPGMGGPVQLTAALHRALNLEPKPRAEAMAVQDLKEPWMRRFEALMDGGAEVTFD